MNPQQRAELERHYRRSQYIVHDGEQRLSTCIDQPHAALAARLAAHGVDRAALISACNPRSEALPPEQNVERERAFEAALAGAGWRWLPALGRSPEGDWEEPAVLVLGMGRAEARDEAARLEQHAFVQYAADGCGRLHFVDDQGAR